MRRYFDHPNEATLRTMGYMRSDPTNDPDAIMLGCSARGISMCSAQGLANLGNGYLKQH